MYKIVDDRNSKSAVIDVQTFDNKEEAIATAKKEWDALSDYDKKRRDAYYVIETDDEDSLDGNYILQLK